jgi:soluble lytic murein transglycosylase-like protein
VFLFLRQGELESGFNPLAVSPTGARGVYQWLPSSAADPGYGIAPFNPDDIQANIQAAAQYDRAMFEKFGSWGKAMMAYNAGPGNIERRNYQFVSQAYSILAHWADAQGELS